MAIVGVDAILAELSALFDGVAGLQANLSEPPLAADLEGRSPVHSIHYDGGLPELASSKVTQSDHFWRSTLFVNREGHGNANTEALLGQLATALLQVIRDAGPGASYDYVGPAPGARSRPDFVNIDGVPYRIIELFWITRSIDT